MAWVGNSKLTGTHYPISHLLGHKRSPTGNLILQIRHPSPCHTMNSVKVQKEPTTYTFLNRTRNKAEFYQQTRLSVSHIAVLKQYIVRHTVCKTAMCDTY